MLKATCLLLTLAVAASASHAAQIRFRDGSLPDTLYTHDAVCVRSDNPGSNAGNSSTSQLIAGYDGRTFRSLIDYDLSALKTLAAQGQTIEITSATLSLWEISGSSAANVTTALAAGADFAESTVTWNTAPAAGNALASGTSAGSGELRYSSAELTAYIQTIVNGNTSIAAFVVKASNETTSGSLARFYSDDTANVDVRPLLTINYSVTEIPEPATLSFLPLVISGWLLRRVCRTR